MSDENQSVDSTTEPLGAEYLQCHATVVNNTKHRLSMIKLDPGMWGKWMQSPTDVPANSQGGFSAQGRSHSPSGTECTVTFQLVGADPGGLIELHFNVPYAGKTQYNITCTPVGAFKVSLKHNPLSSNVGKVTYTINPA